MPRNPSFTIEELTGKALDQFWTHGFHATSIDDLVKAVSVSRHGIYSTFGGKQALFLACFDRYQDNIVTPAFEVVERDDADFHSIAKYFEFQISLAEEVGLPGPGCFVANSATEVAPSDARAMHKVAQHNDRLRKGFEKVIFNECAKSSAPREVLVSELAQVFIVFTNGLWSMSRTIDDADILRKTVERFLESMKEALR